jgi:hypothetical protein
MRTALPLPAHLVSRLIPADDRDWVVGDLIEDAADRELRGPRRSWWLTFECSAIAMRWSAQRARSWFVLPPVRELAAGLVIDGRGALSAGSAGTIVYAMLFCGSIAMLAFGVEVLVGTLLVAAGF